MQYPQVVVINATIVGVGLLIAVVYSALLLTKINADFELQTNKDATKQNRIIFVSIFNIFSYFLIIMFYSNFLNLKHLYEGFLCENAISFQY